MQSARRKPQSQIHQTQERIPFRWRLCIPSCDTFPSTHKPKPATSQHTLVSSLIPLCLLLTVLHSHHQPNTSHQCSQTLQPFLSLPGHHSQVLSGMHLFSTSSTCVQCTVCWCLCGDRVWIWERECCTSLLSTPHWCFLLAIYKTCWINC